ncbi:MAG: hypothetical protein RMX97_32335 [Nostoc sp. DedQUE11]|nr:hypothetical protein [Nostoc sp. DedQUE11]
MHFVARGMRSLSSLTLHHIVYIGGRKMVVAPKRKTCNKGNSDA